MSCQKLTLAEQETIILWDNELDTAEVYTHDARLINKLRELSQRFPEGYVLERFRAGAVRDLPHPQAVRGHPPPVQRGTPAAAAAGRKGERPAIFEEGGAECLTSGNGTR